MPRTNTVNEKWEIAPSLTNGVFCWVRRLWSQHISVTFSPPQPHLPQPLQFVGKRKKVEKPPKQIVEQSRKCWSELITQEFLAHLIFHQRRKMTNIDLPRVLVLWEWWEEKRKGLERSSTKSFYKTIKLPRNSDPSVWKREYYNDNTQPSNKI